jgi:hypothetical protein
MSHQRAYVDMQKAALMREPQDSCIPSSILFSEPIKIGTGYYDTAIDLTGYMHAKKDITHKVLDEVIL